MPKLNLNFKDNNNMTILMHAIVAKRIVLSKKLISNTNVKINEFDKNKQNALIHFPTLLRKDTFAKTNAEAH